MSFKSESHSAKKIKPPGPKATPTPPAGDLFRWSHCPTGLEHTLNPLSSQYCGFAKYINPAGTLQTVCQNMPQCF
jgi:hypothetical protein